MQSKHLCGPVAGAVPRVGASPTRTFQAPGELWEEGIEQGGVTDHGMVLPGAPTPPQLKAFLTAAGELFPGVCTAGSNLVLSDISQCSLSLLAPLTMRNHMGALGVTLLLRFHLEELYKPKARCEQVPSGRLGQPWDHQEKVGEGPAGG